MKFSRLSIAAFSILILCTLTSGKKYKQSIYGTWKCIFTQTSKKQAYGKDKTSYIFYLHFDKNGTGYKEHILKTYKMSNSDTFKIGYTYKVPFEYHISKDDIGNLATLNHKEPTLISVEPYEEEKTKEFALEQISKYDGLEEKFYWHIVPDTLYNGIKSLTFLMPGTSEKITYYYQSKKNRFK